MHTHKHVLSDKRNDKSYIQAMIDYYRANTNLVREFSHDEYPNLKGFDYTSECEFSQSWNEFTKVARGLVIDVSTLEIITFPFPKFMNLTQPGCEITLDEFFYEFDKFDICIKYDGSLGIIFYYADKWHIMTRGSFHSEQAKRGQKMLDEVIQHEKDMDIEEVNGAMVLRKLPIINKSTNTQTALVEIIYPENRIVVDYGNDSKLVRLGNYMLHGGDIIWEGAAYIGAYIGGFKNQTELYNYLNAQDHNFEGFVIVAPDGRRAKIKGDAYLKVHKIRTNITPNSIVENIIAEYEKSNDYNNLSFSSEIMMMLPEEFRKDIEDSIAIVQTEVNYYVVNIINHIINLQSKFGYDVKNIFSKEHRREVMIYIQVEDVYKNYLSAIIATIASNTDKNLNSMTIPSKIICNYIKMQGKEALKKSITPVEIEE